MVRELNIEKIHGIVYNQSYRQSHEHGETHPLQVDKGRVSDNSRVSLEHPETNNGRYHIHHHSLGYEPHIIECVDIVVPIDNKTSNIANGYVYEENDPIWKGIPCKIPIEKTINESILHLYKRNILLMSVSAKNKPTSRILNSGYLAPLKNPCKDKNKKIKN